LLNIIGALDRSTEGEVFIGGTSLNDLDEDGLAMFRNRTMGFIFQSHFLLPQFTVLENVLIPHLIYAGKAQTGSRKTRGRAFRYGGTEPPAEQPCQCHIRRRTAAGSHRPGFNQPARMILADEPTGNLDTANTEKVFSVLQTVNREFKTSFIMVTHNPELAQRSDRYLVMSDGRIVEDKYLNPKGLE
jgi:lipoprotein-releasing system ATP-binding protein